MVIDVTEKLSDFIERDAPVSEIFGVYYVNFIPYIAALLTPLFVFLGVILFTSRMAANTEIVGILGNGISFYRMLRPYLISALFLTGVMVYVNNWLVPHANKQRLLFEEKYVHNAISHYLGIYLTTTKTKEEETHIALERYNTDLQEGYMFTLDAIKNDELVMKIRAPRVVWKPERQSWVLNNYEVWKIDGMKETVFKGEELDTILYFSPDDFTQRIQMKESMDYEELNNFIAREKLKGSEKLAHYLVEKYSRTSNAFAIIVLTFIGVAFSTRKKRGGIGINIAIGLLIMAIFILFLRFSTTFATNANLPPIIAVWIPNVIFGIIAIFLVRWSPK